MSDIAYSNWYDEGSAAFTNGSTTVTGTKTFWDKAGIKKGDILVDHDGKIHEITAVNSSTEITLGKAYSGASASNKSYSIIRMFNATTPASLANQMSELINKFHQRYNLDMKSITGASAFDIAKENGFSGTESEWLDSLSAYGVAVKNGYTGTITEWLESLKAAGEWSALDARTAILASSSAEFHNSISMFRNKGTEITDEQKAAITNHTWDDLFIGDNWTLNGHKYWIAKFIRHLYGSTDQGILMMSDVLYESKMNETDTNEGGYYNSYLANTGLAQAGEILAADWGDLLYTKFTEYLPKTNASGLTRNNSASVLSPHHCMIPTYQMLFGHPFEQYPQDWHSYYSYQRLPLATYESHRGITSNTGRFWLQDCANSSDSFIYTEDNGDPSGCYDAWLASKSHGVAVIFAIH